MMSELSHLKKLSAVRSGKNIKFLTPAVYSGGWCPMRVACNIAEDMQGLSYLMVCMPECATHSRGMLSAPEGPNGELRWLYVLDDKEVIFGCREGVMDALRAMDEAGARAILMVATCVTDLIGEDFEGIISELQPQLKARLTYVTLGQFKNFGSGIGTWKTAEALAELMEPKEVKKQQCNVMFIEPWRAKTAPVELPLIIGALEKRGIPVRHLTAVATLDDYLAASDAELNLVVSSYTQPLAKKMKQRFGTEYSPLHMAFSVEAIDKEYALIEERLGVDLKEEFAPWRKKALELEERAKKELCGKTFVMLTEVDMAVPMSGYLASLGMVPLLIHLDDVHEEDLLVAKQLKEAGIDPLLCRIMNEDRDLDVIRKMEPDICIGYLRHPAPDLKVAEQMQDFFGITGYERTAALLDRIFTVLETGKMGERMDIYGPAPL